MRHYKIREFARRVGVSPQRLSELVRQGKVQTNEAGLIAETEVTYFVREKIKKSVDSHRNSYLLLGTDEAILAEHVERLKEAHADLVETGSITELVVRSCTDFYDDMGVPDDKTVSMVEMQYRRKLLKELIDRVQKAVYRCMNKFADTAAVRGIPIGSLYEMLMYDHLYSEPAEREAGYRAALTKGVSAEDSTTLYYKESGMVPMSVMENSYCSIVMSLGLADRMGKPLISRSEFTPEILKAVREMPQGGEAFPKGEFFQKFFGLPLCLDSPEAKKVLESLSVELAARKMDSKTWKVAAKGFYTQKIAAELTEQEISALVSDIFGGFYKNIWIIGKEKGISGQLPEMLKSAVNAAGSSRTAILEVI